MQNLNSILVMEKLCNFDEKYDESYIIKDQKDFIKKTSGKIIKDCNVLTAATNNHNGLIEVKLKKLIYSSKVWNI